MRLEKWFISNLDDSQRKIIVEDIDKNIVVQGAAGSGKTNLAIHRALQAKNRGSYALVILTVALKRMISYGMNALGLDRDRIAYDWGWTHRGFDMTGDVYWKKDDRNHLYLVNDMETRKFARCEKRTHKRLASTSVTGSLPNSIMPLEEEAAGSMRFRQILLSMSQTQTPMN